MRSLATVSLSEILPANLLTDPFVSALITSFDQEFHLLVEDTAKILLYQGLDGQPASVLDELAWQFAADFYDQSLSLSDKRVLISEAIYWHSKKGTPLAIQRVIDLVFGEGSVEEWFDYSGEPFHFRVLTTGGKFPSGEEYSALTRMVQLVKRASAIFQSITVEQSSQQSLFFGGAMRIAQHITIGSA